MSSTIYFVVQKFTKDTGSYAGFVQEFGRHLIAQGYAVNIVCQQMSDDEPSVETLPFGNVVRFRLPKIRNTVLGSNLDYLLLARGVKRFFKQHPPQTDDVIIANSAAALGLRGRRYILRIGQPATLFLANLKLSSEKVSFFSKVARQFRYSVVQAHIESRCIKHACAFMFPSVETRNAIVSRYGGGTKPFITPYSGVSFSTVAHGKRQQTKGRTLLFVAAGGQERLRKGVVYLEKIIPDLFTTYPDVRLLHVGEPFEWHVPQWCKERIVSVGKVPWTSMGDQYATATVLVSCALQEGFPNTFLEAMAAGLPVITSDINGVTEYITSGVEGIIYPRADSDALKQALHLVLDDPTLLKAMSAAAKKRMAPLDYPVYTERLLTFIKAVTQGTPHTLNLLERP